jgi:hypothetical protein
LANPGKMEKNRNSRAVIEIDQTITDRSRERNSCRKMVALISAAYS